MHNKERPAILSLAIIMASRMLGLFMILPVLSLNTSQLQGATPALIGLALGIYGLTQACLQIPFGICSDWIGRKTVITLGLLLFAAGSILAALSTSIEGIILGRALQGTGAVGSTVLALVSDLTRDENRSKAMATIGLVIGLSFLVAMVLGPLINAHFHLSGIFWTTASLALLSIVLLHTCIPTAPKIIIHHHNQKLRFAQVISHPQLLRLNLGIFSLHAILTASFIVIPILLAKDLLLSIPRQTLLYFSVLIGAFVLMLPFMILAEKKRIIKPVFLLAITIMFVSQCPFLFATRSMALTIVCLLFFFAAFTFLEASLPSLVSKFSPLKNKGAAMGIYSSSQFLGIFIGGSLGGWIFSHYSNTGIFLFSSLISAGWFVLALSMSQPPYLSTLTYPLPPEKHDDLVKHLGAVQGVEEVAIQAMEQLIYLKVDKQKVQLEKLQQLIANPQSSF